MHERWGIRLSAADGSEVEAVAANRNGLGAIYPPGPRPKAGTSGCE